jgi:hypothetical protein
LVPEFLEPGSIEVVAYEHPLKTDSRTLRMQAGLRVTEIVRQLQIRDQFLPGVQVVLSLGDRTSLVPLDQWKNVKPKAGALVIVTPLVEGPVAAIIPALIAAAAPTIASSVFGLTVGTLGFALATTAITVVGSLLVNALIPPPAGSPTRDDDNYSITGSSNAVNKYGVFPVVLGRHRMHPPMTARGFTEVQGEDIYFHGRYTFGFGPVALENLLIGTTPLTDFEDVEVEFRNVDQALTEASVEGLSGNVIAWRAGDEAMTLYPDDVAEDSYSVQLIAGATRLDGSSDPSSALWPLLEAVIEAFGNLPEVFYTGEPVIRETRERVTRASVDISFQGLVTFDGDKKKNRSVSIAYRYRKVGGEVWVAAGVEKYSGRSTALLRFTKSIEFPDAGRYEIEVRRITADTDKTTINDESYLTAIRSFRAGEMPSHADISEVAIRIRASDQINGQLDTLNAIVQQLAPVWDGAAWSTPVPVRHPAWVYARALTGPMLKSPVEQSRVQLEDLKSWADEEPHWTCDAVIDQPTPLAEVLDLIAATGRAKRTLRDLQYSVIRDGGAGPVVQHFSPRNSYDFRGKVAFPKEIHGFRVRVISERLEWEQDEIVVYADGYDEVNATEFETLDLTGVVLSKNDVDGGNAWRLGRYHIAQAILRPEEFEWSSDLEHLPCAMGSKVRLVHDVPLIGVGSARVSELTIEAGQISAIKIDEDFGVLPGQYRFRLRTALGELVSANAQAPDQPGNRVWQVTPGDFDTATVQVGDLILVEEVTQESFDVLVTGIFHEGDLQARIVGVPAAPDVLLSDQGLIPAYDPKVTDYSTVLQPALPQVAELFTGKVAAIAQVLGPDLARAGVRLLNNLSGGVAPTGYRMRWRETGQVHWILASDVAGSGVIYTDTLEQFVSYEVEVQSIGRTGYRSRWAQAGTVYALASEEYPGPVENFRIQLLGDQVVLAWDRVNSNVASYELRHSNDAAAGWDQAQQLVPPVEATSVTLPAIAGAYLIKAVSYFGQKSTDARVNTLSSLSARNVNLVETVVAHPDFTGVITGDLRRAGNTLELFSSPNMYDLSNVFDSSNVYTGGEVPISATFELSETVDLGDVFVSRLTANMRGQGFQLDFGISDVDNVFDVVNVFGDVDGQWAVTLQVSTTNDDPAAAPVWSVWTDLVVGDYEARGFRFRVVASVLEASVTAQLSELSITIDMPDRLVAGRDVICPPAGVQVDFDAAFFELPSITVDGQGLPTGARSVRGAVTKSGFFQQFVDAAGDPVAASFDWQAAGYGRQNNGSSL